MTDEPVRPHRAVERTQHSSADEATEAEVSAMSKETAEKLTEDFREAISAALWDLGVGYPQDPVSLQAVEGAAQALADASGYRVVLQAAVVEPIEGEPNMCRIVGQREVAAADPAVFCETVRE
jgi:hypothetical protein